MMTYTYVEMEVSNEVFEEVKKKLEDAEYHHAIAEDVLDMHGIALTRKKDEG